jgi:hypothetical protein
MIRVGEVLLLPLEKTKSPLRLVCKWSFCARNGAQDAHLVRNGAPEKQRGKKKHSHRRLLQHLYSDGEGQECLPFYETTGIWCSALVLIRHLQSLRIGSTGDSSPIMSPFSNSDSQIPPPAIGNSDAFHGVRTLVAHAIPREQLDRLLAVKPQQNHLASISTLRPMLYSLPGRSVVTRATTPSEDIRALGLAWPTMGI